MSKGTTRAGRKADKPSIKSSLPKGKNYLFVIGIDEYEKHRHLQNPVFDAKAFIKILTEKYQFSNSKDQLITLFNEEATQSSIYSKLEMLAERVTSDDNLVIYFSGHGEYKKRINQGFWIPYDGDPDNSYGSYISFENLMSFIKAIESFHTFIVADSCYAGTLFTARSAKSDVKTRYESIQSRWLLTAGMIEEVPDGTPGKHSPFAKSLLTWLKNNKEERLSVADLCRQVINSIDSMGSEQTPQGESLRIPGNMGGEFMFRLKEIADQEIIEEVVVEDIPNGTMRGGGGDAEEEEDEKPAVEEPKPKPKPKSLSSLEDVQKALKGYLANDEFEEAFELFEKVLNSSSRSSNTVISLQGQYNSMKRQRSQGTVGDDFAFRTFNRIRVALNEMTDDLEDDDLDPSALDGGGGNSPEVTVEQLKTQIEALQKDLSSASDFVQSQKSKGTGSDLKALEMQGYESQLNILQKKLNFFLQEQAIISDPSQKFSLRMRIEQTQQEINEVKGKLGI